MRILLLSLLLFIGVNSLSAQTEPTFEIRYPLKCDFAGSGSEKNQFCELQNGKIVLYRFEADSTLGIKHFVRLWCVDKIGTMQWERIYSIGEGDSIDLSTSLKSVGNMIYVVYSHIDQSHKSTLSLLHLAENGDILDSRKLDIPNEPQVRNISSIVQDQFLVVSFDLLAADSSRSVAYGRIPFGNFNAAQWYQTSELKVSTTLYKNGNEVRFVATKDTNAVDLSLDQNGVYQAIQFPAKFLPQAVTVYNGSRYYTGSLIDGANIFVNSILHKLENNQTSGWAKRLSTVGPSYHGNTSSSIATVNGKIVVIGYGTTPYPITYISVFEENGTLVKTERFDAFHSFNYNRGDLFKHSSGALFFSKLAGVSGGQFATILQRIDTTNFTSCNSQGNLYTYTDTTIENTTTTITFNPANYAFSSVIAAQPQDSFPQEITCHTNLSVDENNELDLEAYPNPFTESFTLRANQQGHLTIHCYDLMGKEIAVNKSVIDDQHIQLTPPTHFTGVLRCRVQTAEGFSQTISMHKLK